MIRKLILPIFLALILTIASNSSSFSQTQTSKTVGKSETVAFLIEQNENARNLIGVQEKRISDLESELAAEKENSASVVRSYELAKSEISSLKSSNEALARAVSINEQTIALLQEDNAKQRDKAKRANRAKWKAIAVAAGMIAVKILIP